MKAYKAFDRKNEDGTFSTNPKGDYFYTFAIGEIYTIEGEIKLCEHGFHFHKNLVNIFAYKAIGCPVCEIDVLGDSVDDGKKSVTNSFKIIRELQKSEMNMGENNEGYFNAGNSNAGDWNAGNSNAGNSNAGNSNAGDSNAGYRNAGNWNAGHSNAGHWNAGSWNAGSWNAGHCNCGDFNTITPDYITVFNKPCPREDWEKAYKPMFLFFDISKWVYSENMSEDEKETNPQHETTGGYIRKLDYKDAFKLSWDNSDKSDRIRIKDLPNFDRDVFLEISGIDVDAE